MRVREKYQKSLDALVLRIESARTQPRGPIFNAFQIEGIESILQSCIDFQPVIPDADRGALITEAVSEAAAQGPVTSDSLLRSLRECEERYLRIPLVEYVLATWIGIRYDKRLSAARVGPARIAFSPDLPKDFERPVREGPDLVGNLAEPPDGFSAVRVRLRARSKHSALQGALEQLDYIRGLWNFRINTRTRRRKTFGLPEPVNRILRGPSYTLHTPRGESVENTLWCDATAPPRRFLYELQDDWTQIRTFERKGRRRLDRISYGNELQKLFIRYVRALDSPEREVSFNQLWSVLEHLVGSVGDYKNIGKRISFLYTRADTSHVQLMMEHLRDVRNGIVHDAQDRSGMEGYLWELKMFTESAFRFHLGAGPDFTSLKTASDFLDLPLDPQALRRQLQLYRKALKYRTR